jgi:DNA polymerase elongation subunit (family B)
MNYCFLRRPSKNFVISKLLGQDITKYRSLFPHVSAAIQSSNNEDKLPSKGDTIKYIYTNSRHINPLCRVASIDSANGISGKLDYDKEKYKEMILDAAETALVLIEVSMEIRKIQDQESGDGCKN